MSDMRISAAITEQPNQPIIIKKHRSFRTSVMKRKGVYSITVVDSTPTGIYCYGHNPTRSKISSLNVHGCREVAMLTQRNESL